MKTVELNYFKLERDFTSLIVRCHSRHRSPRTRTGRDGDPASAPSLTSRKAFKTRECPTVLDAEGRSCGIKTKDLHIGLRKLQHTGSVVRAVSGV